MPLVRFGSLVLSLLLAAGGSGLSPTPTQATAASPTTVLDVATGYLHVCAIKTDATLGCWGDDDFGQSEPPAGTFTAVGAGNWHTCAIRTDETLVCWGGVVDDEFPPAITPTGTFKALSAGDMHTCAIRTDETVACWGSNEYGRATPPSGTYRAVDAGGVHTCAIKTDETLACWGLDEFGESTPPPGDFSAISAGEQHTCAIRTDGTVLCWGANELGQSTPPAGTFTAITASDHTCAIKTDQTLACWGYEFGPVPPPSGTFLAVAAGGDRDCAIRTDHTVVCWAAAGPTGVSPQPTALMTRLPLWRPSIAIALAWSARPALAPVTSYDIRYRVARWYGGFGSWTTYHGSKVGNRASFVGTPGRTYCFSLRAHDADGNLSPWTTQTCTAVPLDDRSLAHSSSWTAGTGPAFYRSTFLRSWTYGARLIRRGVVARRIGLVATTCPTCGTVKVYLGATLLKTVSLYSPTRVDQKLMPIKSFYATHYGTVTIKVVSHGKKVIIDGLAIRRN
jgi:hypothetical protein